MGLFTSSLPEKLQDLARAGPAERDESALYQKFLRTLLHGTDIQAAALYILSPSGREFVCIAKNPAPGRSEFASVPTLDATCPFVEFLREHQSFVLHEEESGAAESPSQEQAALRTLGADMCFPLCIAREMFGFLLVTVKGVWDGVRCEQLWHSLVPFSLSAYRFFIKRSLAEKEPLLRQRPVLENILQIAVAMNHQMNDPLGIIIMKSENFLRKLKRNAFSGLDPMRQSLQETIRSHIHHCNRIHQAAVRFRDEMQTLKREL